MYEHPSIRMELIKQQHAAWEAEADVARLAARVDRGPSETATLLKSAAAGIRSLLSRHPVLVRPARLQPTA